MDLIRPSLGHIVRVILPTFLASVEVDQRQRLILQADKLKEMLGASRLIERTVEEATNLLRGYQDIRLVTAVSGVLRFTASDLTRLGDFLWQLRSTIVERLHLPCTFTLTPAGALFKPSVDRLEERVRENKDARAGSASRPTSPLFAQCLIQPHLSANRWNPLEWRGDDRRRSLVSDESFERESESGESFSKIFLEFDKLKDFRKRNRTSLWDALPKELAHISFLKLA